MVSVEEVEDAPKTMSVEDDANELVAVGVEPMIHELGCGGGACATSVVLPQLMKRFRPGNRAFQLMAGKCLLNLNESSKCCTHACAANNLPTSTANMPITPPLITSPVSAGHMSACSREIDSSSTTTVINALQFAGPCSNTCQRSWKVVLQKGQAAGVSSAKVSAKCLRNAATAACTVGGAIAVAVFMALGTSGAAPFMAFIFACSGGRICDADITTASWELGGAKHWICKARI